MKKFVKVLALVLSLSALISVMTACEGNFFEDTGFGRTIAKPFKGSEITYQATTRFLYSTDGGSSWSETIQEIPTNTTYYLAIEMQVSQSEETKEEKTVVVTVTIPSTTVLE